MALTQEQPADRTVGHPGTHLRSWSIAELFVVSVVASVMDMPHQLIVWVRSTVHSKTCPKQYVNFIC